MKETKDLSVILLAGGVGSRFRSVTPKQFIELCHKPITCYSFDLFMSLPEVKEVVVICHKEFQHLFQNHMTSVTLKFALPGKRRQDSVYNGLQKISSNTNLVCIHDAARPLIREHLVRKVIYAAREHGAATLAIPLKFTVKESDQQQFVMNTPDRSRMWEIQTPQIIEKNLFLKGFDLIQKSGVTVTDDVSVVERIGAPVKLVEGDHLNVKITTPEDYTLTEQLIEDELAHLGMS